MIMRRLEKVSKPLPPDDLDHCFDCDNEFDYEKCESLPFYTVVIKFHIKRCCPLCFPKYQDKWMG